MPNTIWLHHPQHKILMIDASAEFFKRFDNKIHLGTRVETSVGPGAILGQINGSICIQHDDEKTISFVDKIYCFNDLKSLGISLSATQPDHFYLPVYFNDTAVMKVDAGKSAFKAFDHQIKLGSRLLGEFATGTPYTALVLGVTSQGALVIQIKNIMGAFLETDIKNLSQLFANGYEILPLTLQDMVVNTIEKNEAKMVKEIQRVYEHKLPQDFFNRIQTVFQQKNLVYKTPQLFAAVQQQGIVATVTALQNQVNELQSTCQKLAEQNKQLSEKLNTLANKTQENEPKPRRYSMF